MRYKRKSYILEGSIKGYGLLSIYLTLFLYIRNGEPRPVLRCGVVFEEMVKLFYTSIIQLSS